MNRMTAHAVFCLSVLVASTVFDQTYADGAPLSECSAWLVEDLQDNQFTSSSKWDNNHGPHRARLSTVKENYLRGAWSAQYNDVNQFIQVKFFRKKSVRSVGTKGRSDKDQWVTQYRVLYSLDGNDWTVVKNTSGSDIIFSGNSDRNTLVVNDLPNTVEAKYVGINPVAWKAHISMRFDVQGCDGTDVCNSDPCQNGGTCDSCIGCEVDYTCYCPLSFVGIHCEEDLAECDTWLVEDLQDNQITSSSKWDNNHGPDRARLSTVLENGLRGAWSALHNDVNQFIQVKFLRKKSIRSVGTKGRSDEGQWVTQYRILYSLDGNDWTVVKDIGGSDMVFSGNSDRNTLVVNSLPNTMEAKYVRINPVAWNGHISMRFDFQGCGGTDICNSDPCQNGGTCDSCIECEVGYLCYCSLSFAGTNCEKDVAECSAWLVKDLLENQITSSTHLADKDGPDNASLSTVRENNLRRVFSLQHNDINQFIQVKFLRKKLITSVSTKRRFDVDQWVTQYRVLYSFDGNDWTVVKDIGGSDMVFSGNTDRQTLVVNRLPNTVEAKYVGINPVAWKGHISMKLDIQGCDVFSSSQGVAVYQSWSKLAVMAVAWICLDPLLISSPLNS